MTSLLVYTISKDAIKGDANNGNNNYILEEYSDSGDDSLSNTQKAIIQDFISKQNSNCDFTCS